MPCPILVIGYLVVRKTLALARLLAHKCLKRRASPCVLHTVASGANEKVA